MILMFTEMGNKEGGFEGYLLSSVWDIKFGTLRRCSLDILLDMQSCPVLEMVPLRVIRMLMVFKVIRLDVITLGEKGGIR